MFSKADLPFANAKQAALLLVFVIVAIWAYRKFAPAAVQTRIPV